MNRLFLHTLIALFLVCNGCGRGSVAGETMITVVALDEAGAPIAGASVAAGWRRPIQPGYGDHSEHGGDAIGVTDQKGRVTLSVGGLPGIRVTCPGYYSNGIGPASGVADKYFTNTVLALNKPEIPIVLTSRLRPVPMYVRKIDREHRGRIPLNGKPVGFDLIACDWVAPHGQGKIIDLEVTMSWLLVGERSLEYSFKLVFPRAGDGIQRIEIPARGRTNELLLPREAPITGYVPSLEWGLITVGSPNHDPKKSSRSTENDNYVFRVRSQVDASGKVTSAMYGKIHGALIADVGDDRHRRSADASGYMKFIYYLNPDQTRSLEWDMIRNLAGAENVPLEP